MIYVLTHDKGTADLLNGEEFGKGGKNKIF